MAFFDFSFIRAARRRADSLGQGIDLEHLMNILVGNLVKFLKNPVSSVVYQDINLAIAEIEVCYQSF